MFQAYGDLLFVLEQDGTILDYKAGDVSQLYIPPSQFLSKKMQEVLPYKVGRKFSDALFALERDRKTVTLEYSLPVPAGQGSFEARLVPVSNKQIMVFVRDITEYKRAETRTKHQLDKLAALRAIDLSITSGVDLSQTLTMIVENVRAQLKIDAASILLLDSSKQILEFAAESGFITSALQHTHLQVGEGYAGRAIQKRRTVYIADLKTRKTDMLRSPFFSSENFVAYYAVPLIAKGQALGVLEVFHREPIQADQDWLDFMNMLAGQAAIAIDNAVLFRDLDTINFELALAYDKTIEGWARALDLRDKETEKHTRRVAEMTQRLAVKVGIPQDELLHIRRGAILHDVGKVAIPDSILLKPGPLDEEEWRLMRQHPSIAVEMIAPIAYLAPALPIPRSHHEKWDGSGYPDGLAGEAIPISARLFALVDVYDALTTDRPYREAWSKDEAVEYILAQSGKHFDPQFTPAFLELLDKPQDA